MAGDDGRDPGSSGAQRKRRRRRKRVKRERSEFERREIVSTVCSYVCREGLTAPQVQQRMLDEHGVKISREDPYRIFRQAAKKGWIRFTPPQEYSLRRLIKEERYPWLHEVSVVQTGVSEDVAHRGARMLIELLQQHHAGRVAHVGFSGGVGMRTLAQRLAQLLREPIEHLPKAIVFHAMVAGFDVTEPTTDPNAFFSYFVRDPAMQVATSFVGLHAPAMARPRQLSQLRGQPGIKEAYERAHEIDVIVTGASCWSDEHSLLHRYLEVANEPVDAFDAAGCVGDILWQPIGLDGPIESRTNLRAMTVMELGEVGQFVSDKKHVLLVAGPCASCNEPKTEVVHAVLEQGRRLITHLAVDSRCGRELVS